MRDAVYRKLLMEDFAFYNRNRTGDLMSRQTGDMDAIRHFVANVISSIYENILYFGFALIMIFTINTQTGLMHALHPSFYGVVLTVCQFKRVNLLSTTSVPASSSLNTFVQENISGNRVVKAFAKEDYETEKI